VEAVYKKLQSDRATRKQKKLFFKWNFAVFYIRFLSLEHGGYRKLHPQHRKNVWG
jgi:hypothetical protein